MKILKLLNKKYLLIIIVFLFGFSSFAEDQPVDIWNTEIEKKKVTSEIDLKKKKTQKINKIEKETSIYDMQSQKKKIS